MKEYTYYNTYNTNDGYRGALLKENRNIDVKSFDIFNGDRFIAFIAHILLLVQLTDDTKANIQKSNVAF